ncbi:hypothetical protein RF55_12859 [Lasius niger]|uniref:Integrase catalytic domain-containing protein n=1 Tax=Lasius niger TaxID=67767 RepID=A0A0J7KBV8_LASNI|nr:hypothetical protein RF55_12859 [Lasius niger]
MIEQLGDSKDIALRRFYALERKLIKNPTLRAQYIEFLDEYQRLGHMELIEDQDLSSVGYYLPHHPIIKETSLTTKLRVVFDASCKTTTGISLNDVLMVGPTLQQDLLDIIFRFRSWQYVITADVEKMYRQVRIDQSQTQYQRILWQTNTEEEVKAFELKTVTYGTASASFLAIRALQEIAHIESSNFPLGAATVLSDFYVDDLLTGTNDLARAIMLRDEVIATLAKGGFKLRKWASNCAELLQNLPDSVSSEPILTLDKSEHLSTLGLQWHSVNDTLQYEVKQLTLSSTVTKRAILSSVARIFDPLGLLGPVIITAKILIQKLWLLKVDWDETVPLEIQTKWRTYEAQLGLLNTLRINRKVIAHSSPYTIEMHGFCDASIEAYGAVVYIRTTSVDGHTEVRLLCAKSRVAPAKTVTLPRLELCAAHLLAQLTHRISQSLGVKFDGIYHWSDSMITLGWIRADAKRWNTFVSNRVGQIQELTDASSWKHVNTKENPADAISRGITPSQLTQSSLWWNGPQWLNDETVIWDADSSIAPILEDLPEARKSALIATNNCQEWSIFYAISSANRLIRTMAYILRFAGNTRKAKQERRIDSLTAQELNQATIRLAKIVQDNAFATEMKALRKGHPLPRNSKFIGLSPFIDNNGVIRVGGRLSHSKLPYSTKHPIVLPSKHNFTKMLIVSEHQRLLHAGPQSTLASLRQRFWPIAGRSAVRQVTRSCIRCFRAAPISRPPIMGNLPTPRVSPARPFVHCGIDYCGPFMVRESRRRNSKHSKAYAAVFICLSCKAIHIELIFDLSTESFLNAFKRFISRRGKPSDIYTDNGTNFVGAARELKELRQSFLNEVRRDGVSDFSAQSGITWHFIPPQSPHFGGLWEAAVKAMKFHLKRVAGTASLLCDELQTILTQIEAVLNSRPLIPLSNNPNDHTYLSPAHFLIGDHFMGVPEPTLLNTKENRLSRWQRIEQIKQHFWKRWSVDYLNELQQRTKWKINAPSLKPGDLVIVREDNTPPLCWPLARIETVYPGLDGVVRTATVRTTRGIYKRPATRLCPLPLDNENLLVNN